MRIQQLTQLTGCSVHTLRYYESEGLLDTRHVQRGPNNYRVYSEEAVEHIGRLKLLQAAGFTISEIKKLNQADQANKMPLSEIVKLLREKTNQVERRQAELAQVLQLLSQLTADMQTLAAKEGKRSETKQCCRPITAVRGTKAYRARMCRQ